MKISKEHILRLCLSALLLIFIGSVLPVMAQDDGKNNVTHQLWIDFNPALKVSDKFDFKFKTGVKAIYPHSWYKYYTSPEFSFKVPKLIFKKLKYNEKLYAGIEIYFVDNTGKSNVFELAPYQGYTLSWPNRERIVLKHDVKLKERFQWTSTDWDYSFGLQMSYEASLIFKFQGDLWKLGKGFYIVGSIKFYWNLVATSLFNDVTRITPGIGYTINPIWKVSFLVGYNYTRNTSNDSFNTNNIIYRFRVYYKIPHKKKDAKIDQSKS